MVQCSQDAGADGGDVVGGLALSAVLQGWFCPIQGNFGLNVLLTGLSLGATAAIISGFTSLIGPAGIGEGAILTMLIGNPIAGINAPAEFLPGAWGEIGQFFVPGASGTLLRNLSYFPDASGALQWLVLSAWFLLGLALILLGHLIHSRKENALVKS